MKKSASQKKTTGKKKVPTRSKSARELWLETVKSGAGSLSTESSRMNTFSGSHRPNEKNMPYLSTSHFLRQTVGTEKSPKNNGSDQGKAAAGTPNYKSQEEYYDQIMGLKKQIVSLNNDNTLMKSKMRRVEEDNSKKDKEIEQLLDPSKSDAMRRTLADRKPDAGAVIHSLKQKILKLEQQNKDKEASYVKLQSEMKATNIEEMKVQMEQFYAEILRLKNIVASGVSTASKRQTANIKANDSTVKALNKHVVQIREENSRLMTDNKALKEDLQKLMEKTEKDHDESVDNKDYGDMTRKELISALARKEKELDKALADADYADIETNRSPTEGKVVLQGTLKERLTLLDQHETELLDDLAKKQEVIKQLKEDLAQAKYKNEEKEKEIKSLKEKLEHEFSGSLSHRSGRGSVSTVPVSRPQVKRRPSSGLSARSTESGHSSPRRRSDAESPRRRVVEVDEDQDKAASVIQRKWHNKKAAEEEERLRRIEKLKEDHAARTIQKGWRRRQSIVSDEESSSTRLIQATARGHSSRKQQLARMKSEESDDETIVNLQSAMRGHSSRREQLNKMRAEREKEEMEEEEEEEAITLIQSTFKGHSTRKKALEIESRTSKAGSKYSSYLDSEGEDVTDEEVKSLPSSRGSPTRTSRLSSAGSYNKYSSTSPRYARQAPRLSLDDDLDDDDDIMS